MQSTAIDNRARYVLYYLCHSQKYSYMTQFLLQLVMIQVCLLKWINTVAAADQYQVTHKRLVPVQYEQRSLENVYAVAVSEDGWTPRSKYPRINGPGVQSYVRNFGPPPG